MVLEAYAYAAHPNVSIMSMASLDLLARHTADCEAVPLGVAVDFGRRMLCKR